MIGVDYGSSEVKWFDGSRFGTGIPGGRSFTVGLSSSQLLVKESFYPVCSGSKLRKLIVNDVAADLSIDPRELSVAFCRKEKENAGCRFLIFVEKREKLEGLPSELLSKSQITVDILGGVTAGLSLSETFTLIDAGKRKVAVVNVEKGIVEKIEIFRGSFDYHVNSGELFSFVKEVAKETVFLTGGGAFSENFKRILSESVKFTVPEFEPFGEETPIYFNAYGLYNFRKSPCKATFKGLSIFSEELLKERNRLLLIGAATVLSLIAFTGGLFTEYLSAKRDYYTEKRELKEELSKALGMKLLAPEIQIPQEAEKYKQLKEFLKLGSPSILYYIEGVSKSVVKGVKVLYLEGSLSSRQFTIKGRAKNDKTLKTFTEKLRNYFKKVSVSSTRKTGSGISFTVKAEVRSGD